jgi:hypothetical protein
VVSGRREPGEGDQEPPLTRVLFLQRQPCARALKYAVGLHAVAPGIRLAFACQGRTLTEFYGAGDELFERWFRLGVEPEAGLRAAIRAFAPHVLHCHSLPDELTVLALRLAGGRTPVVHDVHDLQSLRETPYEDGFPEPADPPALERTAIEECNALVTVSEELMAEIGARHRAPALRLVFPNYALARDLPPCLPPPERNGVPPRLVYQGTVSTNGSHYDLREIFERIVARGLPLDVHPSRPSPAYRALADRLPGLTVHEPLEPSALMRTLPRYDFGWAGFNVERNRAHIDTALPNKAFEYVGCGLPVLTLRHRALSRLVAERGLGVRLVGLEGLGERLAALDRAALRRRVAAARDGLTIERNARCVIDLYRAVAGRS